MKGYLDGRQSGRILKYGLGRRTEVVIQQLQQCSLPQSSVVLDLGTADGLLLRSFMEWYGLDRCIGLDISYPYLRAARQNLPQVVQADGRRLPFCRNSVEVIIATAVCKHIRGLEDLLADCRRVLKPGGKLIVTDPSPLGIRLGIQMGHFTRKSIAHILSVKDTRRMLTRCGFAVLYAGRFMLTPIPFAGCDVLEKALKWVHLDQLFFNQIVCAECSA
jgi:SAM-dependent methyltransferase